MPADVIVGICALRVVALTRVVLTGAPLNVTPDVVLKPDPVSVSVNAAPLVPTLLGLMDDSTGAGLFTVNVAGRLVPPPGLGFTSVMLWVPPAAAMLASMTDTTSVLPTGVVVSAAPSMSICVPGTRPVAVTSNVTEPEPAVIEPGDSN
jgi:hypothetical protein